MYMRNKCFIIDLDGTMYWGNERVEGAKEFIDYLIRHNHKFIFLTNNAARTPHQCASHMLKMGFENITPDMFYTSAMAASDYITRKYPHKRTAWYIGEDGLKEALLDNGFELNSQKADFLFIGLDRQATYTDYSYAVRMVQEGTILVGTNNDRILLSEKGINMGNGSIIAMFEYATRKEAIKIGKPYTPIIEGALQYLDEPKENCIIIGDNLETDIKMGVDAEIDTILITSGIHTMQDCYDLNIHPTYIIENLKGLLK